MITVFTKELKPNCWVSGLTFEGVDWSFSGATIEEARNCLISHGIEKGWNMSRFNFTDPVPYVEKPKLPKPRVTSSKLDNF